MSIQVMGKVGEHLELSPIRLRNFWNQLEGRSDRSHLKSCEAFRNHPQSSRFGVIPESSGVIRSHPDSSGVRLIPSLSRLQSSGVVGICRSRSRLDLRLSSNSYLKKKHVWEVHACLTTKTLHWPSSADSDLSRLLRTTWTTANFGQPR